MCVHPFSELWIFWSHHYPQAISMDWSLSPCTPDYSWRGCPVVFYIFINTRYSLDYLQGSTFLADLNHIVSCFDKTMKLRFRNSDEPQFIKFGRGRDNNPNCNIRFGQLKLMGSDVAKFFEPSVQCIVKAVLEQCRVAHKPISMHRSCFLYHPLSWTRILACRSHQWVCR